MALTERLIDELRREGYLVELRPSGERYVATASRDLRSWEHRGDTEVEALAKLLDELGWDLEN